MEIREKVRKVVDKHILMRLATIDEEGLPKVRSVDYAADIEDESVLYFMTFNFAKKVKEIEHNNNVHVVIDADANSIEELAKVLYIKASGKAYQVQTPEEMQKGMGLIMQKYPYLKELPGDPSMMLLYRVELDKVTVTDNNVRFGYDEFYNYR